MALRSSVSRAVRPLFHLKSLTPKFFASNRSNSQQEQLAIDMIRYALDHARSLKTGDGYAHSLLVLEQGLGNVSSGTGGEARDNAIGLLCLAMSTLHYNGGQMQDAVEKLEMVHKLDSASLPIRVAAWETLVGVNLEAGEDVTSSKLADDCLHFLRSNLEANRPAFDALKLRAKSLKELTDIVNGNITSGEDSYDARDANNIDSCAQLGNAALSHGEFLHCNGNLTSAKIFYEKALANLDTLDSLVSSISAANMDLDEAVLGANCCIGQLLAHLGKFAEAEDFLTKALTKAEHLFGSSHPKVGIVLTCIALMYKHKAKLEASSSILIQEGLYRRATDLLKAPALDVPVANLPVDRRDIIALVRGGYGELLSIQQNRKGEGEKMKNWAEAVWRNRRLSLAQALDFAEPFNGAVVDTRICRVL